MPFGRVFGSVFFGILCTIWGMTLLAQPAAGLTATAAFIVVLSLSLAVTLLSTRGWGRWAGVAGAVLMGAVGFRRVVVDAGVLDHLILLGSIIAGLLLVLPQTGRLAEDRANPASSAVWLKLSTAVGFVGLVASVWIVTPFASSPAPTRGALPASAVSQRLTWKDFGTGIEQARSEGRPLLAVFVTDWCPYCTKMDRKTWRASSVVQRMAGLVPVKVDAEDTQERNGFRGAELAARFGVQGFPSMVLLDPSGRQMAQTSGYLTPRQLLSWLDDHLDAQPSRSLPGTAPTL